MWLNSWDQNEYQVVRSHNADIFLNIQGKVSLNAFKFNKTIKIIINLQYKTNYFPIKNFSLIKPNCHATEATGSTWQ